MKWQIWSRRVQNCRSLLKLLRLFIAPLFSYPPRYCDISPYCIVHCYSMLPQNSMIGLKFKDFHSIFNVFLFKSLLHHSSRERRAQRSGWIFTPYNMFCRHNAWVFQASFGGESTLWAAFLGNDGCPHGGYTLPETNRHSTWKWMIGRRYCFLGFGLCSEAMSC